MTELTPEDHPEQLLYGEAVEQARTACERLHSAWSWKNVNDWFAD